jgi:hypothetical protein
MNRRSANNLLFRSRPVVKHSLERRRTLKHKSVLLKQYGVYALTGTYIVFGIYVAHKWMNPPEYKTEEEREKS